ncbi:LysE family transporter [Streptomyces sp. NBC_01294]|uniref:LysE family transporter n=1 Tax=Streptomyces sp. NBC_01294 TaxID=2903815 RepID=UPI002DD854F9|nr:LysE family transporter [Streptomyces sp. NBC_01294]WRZ59509.1 LysE family transporter [Streptomyces sp. NBC_01294]
MSTSELMTPALAGAVAGLGVAMPMGAMSVLLLQEAMRSRRTAVAAAAGIAAVDLGYAALATATGPWVASHISPVEAWVRLASAAILLTIAAHGLSKAHPTSLTPNPAPPAPNPASPALEARGPGRSPDLSAAQAPPARPAPNPASPAFEARGPGRSPDLSAAQAPPARPAPNPAPPAFEARGPGRSPASGTGTGTRPAAKAFARYVGLTALNPTTALYFAALTTAQGATLRTGPAGAAFLLGVGLASLLWQQTLAVLGSLAGARISDTARVWTFRLGYGLVAAYALKIAFPLPSLG